MGGGKSVFHNFKLKTSCNKASGHVYLKKEPHCTFDNHRIKAYKGHIYHLHHSAQSMQSLRTTTGKQDDSASIIWHYKINATLKKISPPKVSVPAGKHLRIGYRNLRTLLSLDQDIQFVHLPLADALSNLNTSFTKNKYIISHSGFLSRIVWGM